MQRGSHQEQQVRGAGVSTQCETVPQELRCRPRARVAVEVELHVAAAPGPAALLLHCFAQAVDLKAALPFGQPHQSWPLSGALGGRGGLLWRT